MAVEQDGEQQVVSLRLVFPQRKKKGETTSKAISNFLCSEV